MAYIIHIDTSAENSTTALSQDGKLLQVLVNSEARNHAAVINTHVQALLDAQGIKLGEVAVFSVCGGPGSYTGLRIGMATAKGYCYALDKPMMLHNRLQIMAAGVEGDYRMAVLEARAEEYFIAIYNQELINIIEPAHVHLADLPAFFKQLETNIICVGHIDDHIKSALENHNVTYEAGLELNIEAWAAFSFIQYNCNEFVNLANSEPFYLKQVYTHTKK